METQITIILKFLSGNSKVIVVDPYDPVEATIRKTMLDILPSTKIFCAFKGKEVLPDFSFHAQNINDGDILFIAIKNIPQGRKEFLLQLINSEPKIPPIYFQNEKFMEIARICDITFLSLESSKRFDNTMKLLNQHQQERLQKLLWKPTNNFPTNIPKPSLQDEPLPNPFQKEQKPHSVHNIGFSTRSKECMKDSKQVTTQHDLEQDSSQRFVT